MKPNALTGFVWYKTCRCGGSLQHRYSQIEDNSNRYWVYPTKGQVRLFKNYKTVGYFPLGQLEEKLKEHEII